MKTFNILLCEDKQSDINLIDAYIKSIRKHYPDIDIILKFSEFNNISVDLSANNNSLLVLDMYENDQRKGEEVLELVSRMDPPIPTIIYTTGSKETNPTNYSDVKKYPFVHGVVLKGDKGNDFIPAVEKVISQLQLSTSFIVSDEDDIYLSAEIARIGNKNLNDILHKIQQKKENHEKFFLSRMSSGFSGAAVFVVKQAGQEYILKISKEKKIFAAELENAKKLYRKFPAQFRIDIGEEIVENDEVIAALIELIDRSSTLFNFIQNENQSAISNAFESLFFNNGLNMHYATYQSESSEKYTYIFSKFDNNRYALVRKNIEELMPIVENFKISFDENDIRDILLSKKYKNIDATLLLGTSYQKKLVLSHGDFHAKNIIIRSGNPLIIDTGGISYDYWCMDVCRLVVNLFTTGFDDKTAWFYDINSVPAYLTIAKNIINLEELSFDDKNNNVIFAINWLIAHLRVIFGNLYIKWEFQLGLVKEFIQVSYRSATVPHSKRALSLLAAYESLQSAAAELKSQDK